MDAIVCSTVASALDGMGLHYRNEGELFLFNVGEDGADFSIRIIADDEKELLTTIGYFPVKVSRANLDRMYKVINDLNYDTFAGYFTIDSEDGELSFRLPNNVDGGHQRGDRLCLSRSSGFPPQEYLRGHHEGHVRRRAVHLLFRRLRKQGR